MMAIAFFTGAHVRPRANDLLGDSVGLHIVLTGGLAAELPVPHVRSDGPEVSELGDRKHVTTFRAGA